MWFFLLYSGLDLQVGLWRRRLSYVRLSFSGVSEHDGR